MEFCNLKSQYLEYQNEIQEAISKVLNESRYINGPEVSEFENQLSKFTGSTALSCANGTDALHLALMALEIGPGDEVITTPFTFFATAEMIALVGAKPVFVDINENDFNIDHTLIEAAITKNTKAILPVSLYGQTPDMHAINEIAQKYNITVIEDAAQSFGAMLNGKRSCNLSTLATTSFFPAKPLGCYGDGGAVFTQNSELANKINILRNHGQNQRYHHSHIGINSRLDTIQAAILKVKLNHYPDEIIKRQEIAKRYTDGLSSKYTTPEVLTERLSVWAQYTLRVDKRDQIQTKLSEFGIPSAIHYPMPLHMQECFKYLGYKEGDFKIAEQISKEVISLPMSAHLSEADQASIINILMNIEI